MEIATPLAGALLSATLLASVCIPVHAYAYEGHGIESVSAETLARFAPKPLDAEISRRVQAALDVRAPGPGQLSPDGKRLYFSWNVTGTWQIWRLDGPDRFPLQMTGGEDRTGVAGVAPNGRYLVVSRDRRGEEYPGLYLQNTNGGALELIQHKPKVRTSFQFISEDSRWIYYVANDVKADSFHLYRWDVSARRAEKVFSEDGVWWVADHDSRAGKILLVKATGNLAREIFLFEERTSKLAPLFGKGEEQEYDVRLGARPGEFLVLTNKFENFRRLYRWSKGKFSPLTPPIDHDVRGFFIDQARSRIYFEVNENGYLRQYSLDAKSFRKLSLPPFKDAEAVVLASVSRGGRYAVFSVGTARAPRASFVFDWQTRKLRQWVMPSAPEVDTKRFSVPALEYYPARDGTRIPMFVRRPSKCEPAPCPVIVEFHGGPEGQALPGFSPVWQLFVDAGFVVVQPNVRGSDGYGKAWLHADNGPKRLEVISDIEDVARYIRKNWTVDGNSPRVGVTGGSYGGTATLYAMTRYAGAYDAAVSIVGSSDLRSFLRNTAAFRRPLRIAEYGDPDNDAEALKQLSAITYVDQIRDPLLIIQGVSDPRVPAGEAVQMHEAARKAGAKAELILFADEGHGAAKRENQVLQIGHTLKFFEKHLKSLPK